MDGIGGAVTSRTADARLSPMMHTPTPVVPLWVIRAVAAASLAATGFRINIGQGITVGMVVAVVLLPLWWNVLARYRGAKLLAGLLVVSVANGVWLTELARTDHAISFITMVTGTATGLGILGSMGVILWAREHMTDASAAMFFGLGILVAAITTERGANFATNPWKFGIGTAVTIVALAIAARVNRRWLEIAVLFGILGVAVLTDQRSSFAILILAVILTAIQLRPDRHDRRASTVRITVAIAGLAAIIFNVGQTLILDGYLGDAAQERTAAQIDLSGSLILGGRPELAASFALFQYRPWGFGTGTLPSLADISIAKDGMASIGYQPNNGYVENYMFGKGFELHSLIGDLGVAYGFAGLALAAAIVAICIRSLTVRLATNSASALIIYLVILGFWNLLFSPIFSSTLPLILLLGLVLQRREPSPLSEPTHGLVRSGLSLEPPKAGKASTRRATA